MSGKEIKTENVHFVIPEECLPECASFIENVFMYLSDDIEWGHSEAGKWFVAAAEILAEEAVNTAGLDTTNRQIRLFRKYSDVIIHRLGEEVKPLMDELGLPYRSGWMEGLGNFISAVSNVGESNPDWNHECSWGGVLWLYDVITEEFSWVSHEQQQKIVDQWTMDLSDKFGEDLITELQETYHFPKPSAPEQE